MIGGKGQSSIRPIALGATVQSSTYGSVVPVIMGRAKSPLSLIWEANIRQTSGKKGKGPKKGKKGQAQYSANVDFLIGHNPIVTPLQFWVNQGQKLPLRFVKYSGGTHAGGAPVTITIPDPNFYAVIAVTVTQSYGPITFNDYGSPLGSRTVSGSWELALWNAAYHGADPAFPSIGQLYPGSFYFWKPAMGNVIQLGKDLDGLTPPGTTNIYYAQLWPDGAAIYGKKQSGTDIPAAALNLTFEPILGDGPEFTGNDNVSGEPLSAQQILYPGYAGLGSPAYQSAQTGLPEVSAEILGAYAINPDGDADFADMIEDIIKQGLAQPGFATSSDPSDNQTMNTTVLQRALGCYDWPGFIQMSSLGNILGLGDTLFYYQPNRAGNILIYIYQGLGISSVTDAAGNSWTDLSPGGAGGSMWWASAVAYAGQNSIANPGGPAHWQATCFELGGVDTFDTSTTTSARTGTITTGNNPGSPALIFAFLNYPVNSVVGSTTQQIPNWKPLIAEGLGNANDYMVYWRVVWQPGTYSIKAPFTEITNVLPNQVTLASFTLADPPSFPKPLGDIIDRQSMALVRAQCKAYGLWGSLVMDSQQKAADWLETIYQAANAAPVWSGFKLKSIPYAEASAAGNGNVYTAPTAAGPVAALSIDDFITDSGQPLYSIERKAQVDVPNLLQLQIPSRDSDYNDVVISQPMTAAIAAFGSRKDSPKQFRCVQSPAVARMILNVLINKQNNLRNAYSFKLNAKWKLLEAMDLITLPADPVTGLPAVDVRLTSVAEDDKFQLDCEAEPFIYGTYTPVALPVTAAQPYQPQGGGNPGRVNAPVIFEPVVRLYGATNQAQLWLVVSCAPGQVQGVSVGTPAGTGYAVNDILTIVQSGAAAGQAKITAVSGGVPTALEVHTAGKNYTPATNLATTGGSGTGATVDITAVSAGYGGCLVYISTDGGSSYNQIGQIAGNAVTGVSTGDWPAATDPDTTNNLPLDLSESDGELQSYQTSDEDNFVYPCYMDGGTTDIPYEVMTYAVATLTSAFNYTLEATGVGHKLRRGVFGAPTLGVGVDHPGGSRFAFLGPVGTGQQAGILKLQMDPTWVGKTLHFKFLAVNTLGSGIESLSDAVDYTYTVLGTVGNVNPGGAPAQLFQVNGT